MCALYSTPQVDEVIRKVKRSTKHQASVGSLRGEHKTSSIGRCTDDLTVSRANMRYA